MQARGAAPISNGVTSISDRGSTWQQYGLHMSVGGRHLGKKGGTYMLEGGIHSIDKRHLLEGVGTYKQGACHLLPKAWHLLVREEGEAHFILHFISFYSDFPYFQVLFCKANL